MNEAFILGPRGQITAIQGPRGETPQCPSAKFKRGDVVKRRKLAYMADMPDEYVVAVAVPPNFPPDWVLADLLGKPRPLMHRIGRNAVTYLCVREGDKTPYLMQEKQLLASGKPPVEIGTIGETGA